MRSMLALALIALLGAACGGEAASPSTLQIFDIPGKPEATWGFRPREIRVPAGTALTWINVGKEFHTVTSDDPGRSFDKGASPGERVTLRFDRPGSFPYHCGVHPDMKAVVHVCDGPCR